MFGKLPPSAYADAAGKLGVAPSALGAGYVVFFFYSCAIGAAATTIYANTAPEDFQYILAHSASRVLVAENAEQAAKLNGGDVQVRAAVRHHAAHGAQAANGTEFLQPFGGTSGICDRHRRGAPTRMTRPRMAIARARRL